MKLLRQLALITLLLQSTANVFAYEVNPLIAPPLALDVTALLVANPGALASTHIYISTSVGSYDFLLMSGFRMENDAVRGEVHFNSFNNSCWLTFRLITQIPNAPTLTKSTCTQYLQDEYPRAKITSELSANASFEFFARWSTNKEGTYPLGEVLLHKNFRKLKRCVQLLPGLHDFLMRALSPVRSGRYTSFTEMRAVGLTDSTFA